MMAEACEEWAVLGDEAIVRIEVLIDGLLQKVQRDGRRAGHRERFRKMKRDVPVEPDRVQALKTRQGARAIATKCLEESAELSRVRRSDIDFLEQRPVVRAFCVV